MAAVAIGKAKWALWDLSMAVEIEPKNQEVCKKLEEVRITLQEMKSKTHSLDDVPIRLGSGISFSKKSSKEKLEKNYAGEHDKAQEENHYTVEKRNRKLMLDLKEENDTVSQECTKVEEENNFSGSMGVKKEGIKVEMKDGATNVSKNSNMAESKYRFVNRKRLGSYLCISKSDYQLLLSGKSINYVHSKLGSLVSVRVVKTARDEVRKKEVGYDEESLECTTNEQSDTNFVVKDRMETSEDEVKEAVTDITPVESKKREGEGEGSGSVMVNSKQDGMSGCSAKRRKRVSQLNVKKVMQDFGGKQTTSCIFPSKITQLWLAGIEHG